MYQFEKNLIVRIIFTLILMGCHLTGTMLLAETTPPPPPPLPGNNGANEPDDPEGFVALPQTLTTWLDYFVTETDGTAIVVLDFPEVEEPGDLEEWLSSFGRFRRDWLDNADDWYSDSESSEEEDWTLERHGAQPRTSRVIILLPGLYTPDWAGSDR